MLDIKDTLFQNLLTFCKENNLAAGQYGNYPWIVTISPNNVNLMIIDVDSQDCWEVISFEPVQFKNYRFELNNPNIIPFLKDLIIRRVSHIKT